jgi:hypothetical protein
MPKRQAKAHHRTHLGRSTDMGRVQTHLETDQAKAVVRRAHLGAGAPPLPPLSPTV